ncbi:Putative auto-transporter adhesin, head GIN domain [Pseudozobellia thermophila]|uniref:Putative auto-transporter adhesin, head GIN domain n=2 Tax=Pseudozobellia thermophila TaxID=192903 RepID=A0A1M6KJD5_9FLAO|nr:Putative auto-transporter adhesin, head GIN domain [Pseudozobellia thermophila]
MRYLVLGMALALCLQASAQRKPKIKGNKNVMDYQVDLPPFNAIELKDDLEIRLQDGAREGYAVTADDNLIDVLKFSVEDSTLVISAYYKITRKKKLDITVYYNYLEAITLYDGRVVMEGTINSDELYVNTYDSAKLQLNADAQIVNINMEGNSSGEFNLDAGETNLVLKDRIDVKIYSVSDVSSVKMYKNASVKMEGTTDELHLNLFESSSFKGEKLEGNRVYLNLQDGSKAYVNAQEELELSSKGSSETHLYGSPAITIHGFGDTSKLLKEK